MAVADDIRKFTKETFNAAFEERDGRVVPDVDDLSSGNEAVKFDPAAILYADLSGSTKMVDNFKWWFAAKVYKVFLNASGRLIRHHGGDITAYDGDRVMGVFIGDKPRTRAVKCALRIKYVVNEILRPELKAKYPDTDFSLRHTVGIDSSIVRAAKTGVRGDNDLVWVGRAANWAAKLSSLNEDPYSTFITKNVYDNMGDDAKFTDGTDMWEQRSWQGQTVYRSSWQWAPKYPGY